MPTANFNAVLAEMTPEEIRLLPRFVATWLDAGLMDEDEAAGGYGGLKSPHKSRANSTAG